jgi:hypothetical protein
LAVLEYQMAHREPLGEDERDCVLAMDMGGELVVEDVLAGIGGRVV